MDAISLVIGRFQPFHNGHLSLIEKAAANASQVIVAVGSANCAPTVKNPFSAEQRIEFIKAGLPEHLSAKVIFVPVADQYDDAKWVKVVETLVSIAAKKRPVTLFGHEKDNSSYYLRSFPFWKTCFVEMDEQIDATGIRKALFADGGRGFADAQRHLPAGVFAQLQAYIGSDAHKRLCDEFDYIQKYKQSWAAAPYAPVLVTVDSVIRHKDKILLVTRKGQPGRGLLALPGGFLDVHEEPLSAALRETQEETGLRTGIAQYLKAEKTFTAPGRSQLGRVITFAYYFDLSDAPLAPEVVAGDDAAKAEWELISSVATSQACMHDDHFNIISHFLGAELAATRKAG